MRTFPGEPPLNDTLLAWTAPVRACRIATASDTLPAKNSKQGGSVGLAHSTEQPDLYYLEAVLVTAGYTPDPERKVPVGWNRNDEFFDTTEAWLARSTPEDKPLNRNHDCHDIVGHITGCSAEALDGTPIPDDAVAIPEAFNLVTKAVLYRVWYDGPELAHDEDREADIDALIAEVEAGKWHVSMECLVRDFDYALLNKDGTVEIVARSKATAHLTNHLRAAGGKGVYEGRKIARMPRKIIFSGKGLVASPANPKSVVRAETDEPPAFLSNIDEKSNTNPEEKAGGVYPSANLSVATEQTMQELEALKGQVAALQAQLADLTNENKNLKAGKLAELEGALASEKAAKAALEEAKKGLEEATKAATAQFKAEAEKAAQEKQALETALAEARGELDRLAADKKNLERTTALVAALKLDGKGQEKAQAMVDALKGLSDEAFAAHLEVLQAIAGPGVTNTDHKPANTTFGKGVQTPQVPKKQTNLPNPPKHTNLPPNGKVLAGTNGATFTADEGGADGGADLDGAEPNHEPDLATASANSENVRVLLAGCFKATKSDEE